MEGRAAWRTDMDERNKQLKQQQEQAAWLKQQMEERAKQKADSQARRRAEDAEGDWGGGRQMNEHATNQQAAASAIADAAPKAKQPPQPMVQQPAAPSETPVSCDDDEESIFALPSKPQQIKLPGLGGIAIPVSLDEGEPKQKGAPLSKKPGMGAGKGAIAAPAVPAASRGRGGARPPGAAEARGGSARAGRGAPSGMHGGKGDNANGVQANGRGAARSARPRVSSAPSTDSSASSLREQLASRESELREVRAQLQRQQQTIEQQAAEIARLRASDAQPQPRAPHSHAAPTRHASENAPDELQRLVGSVFKTEGQAPVATPIAGAVPGSKAAAKRAEAAAAAAPAASGFGNGTGQDHFLSATKACVRADSTRCGSIDAADLFRLCAQYKVEIPPDKVEAAKKKGRVAYTKFIDELRVPPATAG